MTGAPGWYPDPGGRPDRYRFWDGTSWSAQITDDPHRAAPSTMAADAVRTRPHAARWLVAITIVAVLVAAGSIVLRIHDQPPAPPVLFPSPAVRDDRGRAPTTPPADASSSSPESPAARAIGCPEGAPDARAPHPADTRVYGGNLSFARVESFVPEAPENRLTFAYDVVQQVRTVSLDPPWIAQLTVGRLLSDGYPRTAQHTAELVTECIVASQLYLPYDPQRHDLTSRLITVSGVDGWIITTDIVVRAPGIAFTGDHVAVVVIPDGADWGLFFGAVPIGDEQLTATLTGTLLGLRVG